MSTIGVMITASHNPEEDNGVKLVDPHGEMLEFSWEKVATDLANAKEDDLEVTLNNIATSVGVDMATPASVVVGMDTRPSSASLSQAVQDGVKATGGKLTDYGIVSTPQLHFMVRSINTNQAYGIPTAEGYYEKLAKAFIKLNEKKENLGCYKTEVRIDGANGVGADVLKKFLPYLKDSLQLQIFCDGSGKLNYQCGADFVKTSQKAPIGIDFQPGTRYASFDGDADRIVYYYANQDGTFQLLDGDKIATLVAGYLKELVNTSGLDINIGLVQTAYANGSSTDYINNTLKVPVACVATGVKHLHHKATEYDVGVYFEANGHGTVLFSDEVTNKINNAVKDASVSQGAKKALERLQAVIDVINQTVGDALSDLLLVETVLRERGWDCDKWNNAYKDLPNRQMKVKVKDRTVIKTTDAERKTTSPAGLQEAIDEIVLKYPKGRSFVRPSGTEDVVRVYAESNSQENTDRLAVEVGLKVYELAGGVGDKPSL